jgi:hypothetical protein
MQSLLNEALAISDVSYLPLGLFLQFFEAFTYGSTEILTEGHGIGLGCPLPPSGGPDEDVRPGVFTDCPGLD